MPTGVPPAEPVTSGKAKMSLVLGILSLVCLFIHFIPAFFGLIVGILGIRDIGKSNGAVGGKGMAITGIVLSCLGFVCNCMTIGAGIPGYMGFVETRNRIRSTQNLKILGIAVHNYASTYQDKLPGAIGDTQGPAFLSHRVQLLPYVEGDSVYRSFDLKQSWDSTQNKALLSQRPKFYDDPANPMPPEQSNYRFFVGPNTLFSEPGSKSKYTIANIPDGTSNTMFAAQATDGVIWSKPEELANTAGIKSKLGPPGRDYFLGAMMDGSVRMVKKTVSEPTLKNAIDPADGNVLGIDW